VVRPHAEPNAPVLYGSLYDLFLAQLRADPTRCAIFSESRNLTYRELEQYASGVARKLRKGGLARGEVVPVVMERGWEQVAAVLGVLKCRAAYVPIDPYLPEHRRLFMLRQVRARWALTQSRFAEQLRWPADICAIEVDRPGMADSEIAAESTPADPSDLAYVIYTSGSTGHPKGVMIDQRGVINTIADVNHRFQVGPSDRVLSVSSLSFDLSVYDVFGLLAAGGALVMPPHSSTPDPERWLDLVERCVVTIWNSVPALMEVLVGYLEARRLRAFGTLRLVLLSGDWIPISLPDRIRNVFGDVEVVSLGGATEASIWSIHHRIGPIDSAWTSIPYGSPLTGQDVYVLDENLEPIRDAAAGELFIGGEGVARGYWSDPAKTAAAFMPDPVNGQRMYRTGDYGRRMMNGEIEFLGRKDQQIKIRGYRVELGELESTLETHPDVQRAIAFKQVYSVNDQRLLVCIVARAGAEVTEAQLRDFMAERLPSYMLPAAFIFLDAVPISTNGKVDRQALSLMMTVDPQELDRLLEEVEEDRADTPAETELRAGGRDNVRCD
jgi:amino acid adenylation domain-containing protein